MNSRMERFFRAIEFTRVLFDPERSYPFAQFMNKQILNEIKAKAKLSLLQHPKSTSGKSPLADIRRRSSITIGAMNLESSYKLGNRVSAKTYLQTEVGHQHHFDSALMRASETESIIKKFQFQQSQSSLEESSSSSDSQ